VLTCLEHQLIETCTEGATAGAFGLVAAEGHNAQAESAGVIVVVDLRRHDSRGIGVWGYDLPTNPNYSHTRGRAVSYSSDLVARRSIKIAQATAATAMHQCLSMQGVALRAATAEVHPSMMHARR